MSKRANLPATAPAAAPAASAGSGPAAVPAASAGSGAPAAARARRLGLVDATCTLIGIILGSGIFVAPAHVAAVAPGRLGAALVWLGGGLIALCGAMCYAECAARMPEDGGFFIYYERAFGTQLAQVAGWAAWLVTYPASLTATSWIAAGYLHGMLGPVLRPVTWAAILLVACAAVVALGVAAGSRLQRVLTGCKLAAIALVVLAAAWHAGVGAGARLPTPGGAASTGLPFGPALALTAFATTMWTFDGWSDITMLAGELKDPRRNLIRAVGWGIMVPATCYALLQVAVLTLLPADQAMRSDHVLLSALEVLGGRWAASGLGCLALVCAVGALHGVLSAVCRLGWSMADKGELPRPFARRHRRLGTPLAALVVPLAMALGYLAAGNFSQLMGYFAFSVWLYYALTAVAMIRLRRLGVGNAHAWRSPGGYLAPAVVMATALVMTGLQLVEHPRSTLVGVGILAGCALVQRMVAALRRPPAGAQAR